MNMDDNAVQTFKGFEADDAKVQYVLLQGKIYELGGLELKAVAWQPDGQLFVGLFTSESPLQESDYFHAMMDGGE